MRAVELIDAAQSEAGAGDFGIGFDSEGLERLVDALEGEAELTDLGREIMSMRLRMLLVNRLRIEATVSEHPDIADEEITAPMFIIGLPRTGTTALSQLLAADPQVRSLRLWESSDPVPPPEAATQDRDPRIAASVAGLDAMYATFPKMRSLYSQSATAPTECQDLLGMSFRTAHFDGMAHVPSYTSWVLECDMGPTYRYHRRTLQLLGWHCPPRRWHLKTPVHMFALDALDAAYPDARFIWTHRDPVEVMGSVCSLIAYTRSWVSGRDDHREIGAEQCAQWCEALRRAMAFRDKIGEERFVDINFGDFQRDPLATLEAAYPRLELVMDDAGRSRLGAWADQHRRGAFGQHEYSLGEVDLTVDQVRAAFAPYRARFEVPLAGA